jgi:tetratricopeptide (TPR) repeat protein
MIVVLSSAITAIIIIMGVTVFIQNNILKDDISLWSDNAQKAPNLEIVHANLGAALLTAGRYPDAFVELTKAQESPPSWDTRVQFKTYQLLGDYYLLNGDTKTALIFVEKALEGLPFNADLYNSKAILLMQEKKPGEAEIVIKKATSFNQDKSFFHVNLGIIYLLRGHPDAAIKEAQKAILLGGNHFKAYSLLSAAFKAKKDYKTSDHFSRVASGLGLTKKPCP